MQTKRSYETANGSEQNFIPPAIPSQPLSNSRYQITSTQEQFLDSAPNKFNTRNFANPRVPQPIFPIQGSETEEFILLNGNSMNTRPNEYNSSYNPYNPFSIFDSPHGLDKDAQFFKKYINGESFLNSDPPKESQQYDKYNVSFINSNELPDSYIHQTITNPAAQSGFSSYNDTNPSGLSNTGFKNSSTSNNITAYPKDNNTHHLQDPFNGSIDEVQETGTSLCSGHSSGYIKREPIMDSVNTPHIDHEQSAIEEYISIPEDSPEEEYEYPPDMQDSLDIDMGPANIIPRTLFKENALHRFLYLNTWTRLITELVNNFERYSYKDLTRIFSVFEKWSEFHPYELNFQKDLLDQLISTKLTSLLADTNRDFYAVNPDFEFAEPEVEKFKRKYEPGCGAQLGISDKAFEKMMNDINSTDQEFSIPKSSFNRFYTNDNTPPGNLRFIIDVLDVFEKKRLKYRHYSEFKKYEHLPVVFSYTLDKKEKSAASRVLPGFVPLYTFTSDEVYDFCFKGQVYPQSIELMKDCEARLKQFQIDLINSLEHAPKFVTTLIKKELIQFIYKDMYYTGSKRFFIMILVEKKFKALSEFQAKNLKIIPSKQPVIIKIEEADKDLQLETNFNDHISPFNSNSDPQITLFDETEDFIDAYFDAELSLNIAAAEGQHVEQDFDSKLDSIYKENSQLIMDNLRDRFYVANFEKPGAAGASFWDEDPVDAVMNADVNHIDMECRQVHRIENIDDEKNKLIER